MLGRINLHIILITALCMLLPFKAFAAETAAFLCLAKGDLNQAKTQALLAKVQREYAKINTLSATFLQSSRMAALESLEHSAGKVWFVKPGNMKWHYESPELQDFILKDNTSWLYQPDIPQVVVDEVSDVLISNLPVAFLMGIGDLTKDFDATSACRTSHGVAITLVPKKSENGEDQELKGFQLLVDQGSALPRGALVTDIGDNITALVLHELKTNLAVSEAIFATEFPPDTDILDRREFER